MKNGSKNGSVVFIMLFSIYNTTIFFCIMYLICNEQFFFHFGSLLLAMPVPQRIHALIANVFSYIFLQNHVYN